MFSVLKSVFKKISLSKVNKDECKDIWIKIILELFSEIHQIDHNINKIFAWLLSESKLLFETNIDVIKLEIYLNALLSALKIAIDRKQEVKGLETLLNDICLVIIATDLKNNDTLFKIAMKIIQYLCNHTDNVWIVCSEFATFQLSKYCNITDQTSVFKQICQFILMLIKCAQNLYTPTSNIKNVIKWTSDINSMSCTLIWDNNYLQILCKTIFFDIYSNHKMYQFIDDKLLYELSQNILISIDTQKAKLETEHFLIIQWIADILFNQSDEEKTNVFNDSNLSAKQYRNYIKLGLKSEIKVIEKISIQLFQKYHKFIVFPNEVTKECIDSIIILWNVMYEVRASTVSHILQFEFPKLLQLMLSCRNKQSFDMIHWLQSILDIIWMKGLDHRNKAIRRTTMYCLLSWDFHRNNVITPFTQSFMFNEFLCSITSPLWFRTSYYDITKNKTNQKYTARPMSQWQNVNSKAEEALSTKSPPEGFGFLIESFLTNYLFQFISDNFAKQVFLSEFLTAVSTKVTSFNSLYHIFGFLMEINEQQKEQQLYMINKQNLKQFQSMISNFVNKFAPLYKQKLIPLICKVIAVDIDPNIEFYSVCKLINAIPKRCISPNVANEGFICFRSNLNKSDWIGKELLLLIQQYIKTADKSIKVGIIGNMLQFIECTASFHNIIDILFEVASVSYSQPYKSQSTVQFCMQLLSFVINLTENHAKIFAKHRQLLRQRMMKPMNEILSYTFDKELVNADFSNDGHWIFNLSANLVKYYGDLSQIESFITCKVEAILIDIYAKKGYYALQDFPSLFLLSLMIKYHYKFTKNIFKNIQNANSNNVATDLLTLLMSLPLLPNLHKTHCNALQTIQFNAILGILSAKNIIINPKIARKVIQFGVDALDSAHDGIKADILESISLSLAFGDLSSSNLKILSQAAWYILSAKNRLSISDNYCVELLLFPTLFHDIELHAENGHIRKQIMKAFESKKSTVLQPMIGNAFLLWYKYPHIAELYVDQITAMCHTVYHEKIFDPQDRINRDEYLFGILLMYLSMVFEERKNSKKYESFKSLFIDKLFKLIDSECELNYLDVIHQKTWSIFWHLSQFMSNEYGVSDARIAKILAFLCNLCYNDRKISSNQRQWMTLSIIRIILQTPKHINCLYKKHKIINRKPNTHVWLMYALGDTANKLVIKYESSLSTATDSISKQFLCDTLKNIIYILAPYLTNNYGLLRTTSQYFFYFAVGNLMSIDANYKSKLDPIIIELYNDISTLPDSIKLRKRLSKCYRWLEKCNQMIFKQESEEEEEAEHKQHESDDLLSKQLRISQNKTNKATEAFQDQIVERIFDKYPLLTNNKTINEIVWLIKNRAGFVSFTEQLTEALSNVLVATFRYYNIEKEDEKEGGNENKTLIAYQRKLDPFIADYTKLLEVEQLALEKEIKTNRRKLFGDVIVVASLLEKATNVGGICRTCEIFGVKKMVVHDKRVLNREDFKKLSVSSEQWLPIKEIARNKLIAYLKKEKAENKYIIIGLEQTTNSILLNNMTFAGKQSKCIIIIGKEKYRSLGSFAL